MQTRFGSSNVSYDVTAHVEFTGIIAICNPKHLSPTTLPTEARKSQETKSFTVSPQYFGAFRMEYASCNPSGT